MVLAGQEIQLGGYRDLTSRDEFRSELNINTQVGLSNWKPIAALPK